MEIPLKAGGPANPEISVLLSNSTDGVFKNFRCCVCGKIVFSYDNSNVKMILTSGRPDTTQPLKLVECTGAYFIYSPDDIYQLLHSVLELVYATKDLAAVREALTIAARDNDQKAVRCHARYFIS